MYDVIRFQIHLSTKSIHILYTSRQMLIGVAVNVGRRDGMSLVFTRDECDDYVLDGKCAILPKKVMDNRYDDPLFLSYGDMIMDEKYWCEACETKVDPKEGFYTCNDCGVVLHISCLFGDFSYISCLVHLFMLPSVLETNISGKVP